MRAARPQQDARLGNISLIPLRGNESEMRNSVAAFATDPLTVSDLGAAGGPPCGAASPLHHMMGGSWSPNLGGGYPGSHSCSHALCTASSPVMDLGGLADPLGTGGVSWVQGGPKPCDARRGDAAMLLIFPLTGGFSVLVTDQLPILLSVCLQQLSCLGAVTHWVSLSHVGAGAGAGVLPSHGAGSGTETIPLPPSQPLGPLLLL